MPVLNYGGAAYARNALTEPAKVLAAIGTLGQILLVLSVVVGIGLLSRHRWGWLGFLVYAPALVAHNVWTVAAWPSGYNVGAVIQTAVAFGAMGYFLRRDVFAPYLSAAPRGWRRSNRKSVSLQCSVDGEPRQMTNIAAGGCFVEWHDCGKRPGEQVVVSFVLDDRTWEFKCGVARVVNGGAGLAFRGVPGEQRDTLERAIRRMTKSS